MKMVTASFYSLPNMNASKSGSRTLVAAEISRRVEEVKTSSRRSPYFNRLFLAAGFNLLLVLALGLPAIVRAADAGKTFSSPEMAAAALTDAVNAKDHEALSRISRVDRPTARPACVALWTLP